MDDKDDPDISTFYVGLLLAVSSSFFIGASFIIKKVKLNFYKIKNA